MMMIGGDYRVCFGVACLFVFSVFLPVDFHASLGSPARGKKLRGESLVIQCRGTRARFL